MKKVFVLISMLIASSSFAETWYGYCVAEKNDVRYCTSPIVKTDSMKARCIAFAETLGSTAYSMYYGTDLSNLEEEMAAHCDQVKRPEDLQVYSCKYAKLCKNSVPNVRRFEGNVFAGGKVAAINRCASKHGTAVTQKLKEVSAQDCYLKLIVEKHTSSTQP